MNLILPLEKHLLCLLAVSFSAASGYSKEVPMSALPDHPNGVYKEGEPIHWQIQVDPNNKATSLSYVIKKGGLTEVGKGTLPLENGKASLTASLPEAGTLLVEIKAGQEKGLAGAVVAPEKIHQGVACPEDFDAFWKEKVKDLEAIPANPVLTSAPSGQDGVQYEKITMDNIRGTHVYGQIARPSTGTKFPAILQVQYAGVYPLQKSWVTSKAAQGWLSMNIMAHDLPIDEPESFYKEQGEGALKNYTSIGNESRETSYFLRMFLGCKRAADYLASRPDWDGKTLVVIGTSQGGVQSFVTAALHPQCTAVLVEVPAGCDPGANADGRAFGWPYWGASHSDKVMATSRYFDAVNFASRIKCPLLVGVGLVDTTSPAGCVYAAFDAAPVAKEIVPMPESGHKGAHEAYRKRSAEWLKELVAGKPAPIAK